MRRVAYGAIVLGSMTVAPSAFTQTPQGEQAVHASPSAAVPSTESAVSSEGDGRVTATEGAEDCERSRSDTGEDVAEREREFNDRVALYARVHQFVQRLNGQRRRDALPSPGAPEPGRSDSSERR